MPRARTLLGLGWVASLWACGPVQSTALLMDADVQLEAARVADAPKLAPYEYTAAEAYARKAREEQSYSGYDLAIDFARKAVKLASEAKQKAMAEGPLQSEPVSEKTEPAEPDK